MAVVEAKDFIKARDARKHAALTPEGARVGFAGGRTIKIMPLSGRC